MCISSVIYILLITIGKHYRTLPQVARVRIPGRGMWNIYFDQIWYIQEI